MVPPNGATDQSPDTVVVLQATGAQLESVEVRALALRSSVPGRFDVAGRELARSRRPAIWHHVCRLTTR